MSSLSSLLNPTPTAPPKLVAAKGAPSINGDVRENHTSSFDPEKLLKYQKVVCDVPSPLQIAASLDEAIGAASVVTLRQLLHEITHSNEAAERTAAERLLTSMSDESVRGKLQLDVTYNNEAEKSQWLLKPMKPDTTLKRKALEECKNCKMEYRVTENFIGNCIYHPGHKTKDYDSEAFMDCWNSAEEPDSDDPEFQDGFPWTCCNQRGDAKGCIVTKHEPFVTKKRKRGGENE